MEPLQLSHLLACLYRAPLDPGGWQEFLDFLTKVTGAGGGGFMHHDLIHQQFTLRAVGGPQSDPAVQQAYNSYYGALDPWRDPYLALRTESVVPGHALVPIEQLRKTEIYNDLLLPSGVVHPVILPGIISAEQTENVTLWWSEQQGPPGDEVVELLELLRPHLKTSLETLHALAGDGLRARTALAVLDHMHQAVFLLNESLRVYHVNHAAELLLQRTGGMSLVGGHLTVAPALQGELDACLHGALEQAKAKSEALHTSSRMLAFPHPSGKRGMPVRILPLRIESESPSAHVLVLVNDQSSHPHISLDTMRVLFGATPTEVAIANGLLAGLTVGEIAQKRRISEDTTRSHLKMLFQRTGTGRQSELVLLLLGLPRILADSMHS